ncbi:MAG: hypothetical protein HFJ54_08300 [Clostridia bacterium]|nr:hypothetical protein [Clostridia bacterium]
MKTQHVFQVLVLLEHHIQEALEEEALMVISVEVLFKQKMQNQMEVKVEMPILTEGRLAGLLDMPVVELETLVEKEDIHIVDKTLELYGKVEKEKMELVDC